mmetsp:Transcript_111750/g.249669  ORF Transcript_111750/g.249669 Transcript_111750/m.249669 type:complete len:193 (-) Transcript_111750:85-663(-)
MYTFTNYGTTKAEVVADNVHKIDLMTRCCGGLEGEDEVLFLGKDAYVKRVVTATIKVPPVVQHAMQLGPTYSESMQTIEPQRPKMKLDNSNDMFLSKLEQEIGNSSMKVEEETYDETAQSQMETQETAPTEQGFTQKLTTCPKGHGLVRRTAKEAGQSHCALCGDKCVPKFTRLYSCHGCSYDLCSKHGAAQ